MFSINMCCQVYYAVSAIFFGWKVGGVVLYLFLCMINFQNECIEKVEQVVRIKQKQEEDKAAVKLHSFKLVLLIVW